MKAIHELYIPSQPSIFYEARQHITYTEIPPAKVLQPYIYCYWQLATNEELGAPFSYRVVSDGCIDILIEAANLREPYITGFSSQYMSYDLGNAFNYLGIRFLPAGFPVLFNLPASDFVNNFLKLDNFLPKLTQVLKDKCPQELKAFEAIVNDFFVKHFSQVTNKMKTDDRVINAMSQIIASRGCLQVKELDVGLSERQLRRSFEFYFGDSPKVFGKVIRFQNILKAKPSSESLKHNKLFYDVGYYDQSHFIKEFKSLYGVTPNVVFGR